MPTQPVGIAQSSLGGTQYFEDANNQQEGSVFKQHDKRSQNVRHGYLYHLRQYNQQGFLPEAVILDLFFWDLDPFLIFERVETTY